jgi:hypothetical protein
MLRALCALIIATAAALAGCGGGSDEPSKDDIRTVKSILSSTAAVQRAVEPLYACDPAVVACYRQAGPQIVEVVDREREAFGDVLAATDNECLSQVGGLFDDSLDAYAEAGRAAAAGDAETADRAINRSSRSETAYIKKLDECGFAEGKTAEVASQMRRVNVKVIELVTEITSCKDKDCVLAVGRELEATAREGMTAVDAFLAAVPKDTPDCVTDALDRVRRSFRSLELTAVAVQKGDSKTAEREGAASDELRAQGQELLAECLGTAL